MHRWTASPGRYAITVAICWVNKNRVSILWETASHWEGSIWLGLRQLSSHLTSIRKSIHSFYWREGIEYTLLTATLHPCQTQWQGQLDTGPSVSMISEETSPTRSTKPIGGGEVKHSRNYCCQSQLSGRLQVIATLVVKGASPRWSISISERVLALST